MINLRILIVDDVSIMRRALKNTLVEHCKADVELIFEAVDGTEALAIYQQCNPDIVFLDITMPDYDGKTVVRELIKIDPGAKIIMYTGSGDKMNVVECIRAGAKDYVRKPPTPERLHKALEKVINSF